MAETAPESAPDVLVVGAGPVGLALALELGHRGVSVLVVERSERGGLAPRAKTTNTRTRAHLRRWGIADTLAKASPLGVDYPNDVHFVTALGGHPITIIRDAFNAAPARNEAYPEHAQWIPQYALERVMLERALTLPTVTIRFATRFCDAAQDRDGVTSTIEDSDGARETVRSRYLVGADGARSTVRDLIGAKMHGTPALSRHSNVIFRAPGLADQHPHGPGVMYVQMQADGVSIVGPMDQHDVWYFGSGVEEGAALSDEGALAAIRETTQIDLPYEILSRDIWVASELIADMYAQDKIILAGDACHLHPPFGGYGMNMGVGDAVDLGWKIAAQLQGWGGAELVASYESERRPVHQFVIEEALANHKAMLAQPRIEGLDAPGEAGDALRAFVGERVQAVKAREFHTLGTVLGLCYRGSAIIAPELGPEPEPGPPPPQGGQVYTPSSYPGSLAPHGWLDDGRSLYDLFGMGFALLVADSADPAEVERAQAEADDLGVELAVIRPGEAIMQRYDAPLTLVRPDQIVAWRGDRWTGALGMATGQGPASA